MRQARLGGVAALVGAIGAQVIYGLIWIFCRKHARVDVPWLVGPIGGATIGDETYREVCEPRA